MEDEASAASIGRGNCTGKRMNSYDLMRWVARAAEHEEGAGAATKTGTNETGTNDSLRPHREAGAQGQQAISARQRIEPECAQFILAALPDQRGFPREVLARGLGIAGMAIMHEEQVVDAIVRTQ